MKQPVNLNPNIVDLEDILFFIKKRKKNILFVGGVFFILAAFGASYKAPLYLVQSVFKEGGSKPDLFSSSMLQTILKDSSFLSSPPHAASLMRARSFCEPLIASLGLQAKIKKPLFVEWRERIKKRTQGRDSKEDIEISLVDYRQRSVGKLSLTPVGEEIEITFQNRSWKVPKKEQTIFFEGGAIFVKPFKEFNQKIDIALFPLEKTTEDVLKRLKIKARREDGTMLDLTFQDPNPKKAAAFLNGLMKNYQKHLELEREKIAQMQLNYLHQRQSEIKKDFHATLQDHARYLNESLNEQGFLALAQHLEKIQKHKTHNQDKQKEISLKLQTLEQLIQDQSYQFYDPILGDFSKPLQEMLLVLSKEKNQEPRSFLTYKPKDCFSFASKSEKIKVLEEKSFKQKLKNFPGLKHPYLDLSQAANLKQAEESLAKAKNVLEKLQEQKKANLLATLQVEDQNIQIFHLKQYVADVEDIPVYLDILKGEKKLHDPYYSSKEKEKILEDLNVKRKIFEQELIKKNVALTEKIDRQKRKILSIENNRERLLENEESFIKKQIEKQWQEKKDLLALEYAALEKEQTLLKQEEKQLPQKWLQENQLRLEADLNLALMEGLSRMIESKNIEFNLAYLQSSIIDEAFLPLKPKVLLIIPFGVLISCLSMIASITCQVLFAFRKGFPLSIKGLRHRGVKALEYLDEKDVENYFNELVIIRKKGVFSFFLKDPSQIFSYFPLSPGYLLIEVSKESIGSKDLVQISEGFPNKISYQEALQLLYHSEFCSWKKKVLEKYSFIFFGIDFKEESFLAKALYKLSDESYLELKDHRIEELEFFLTPSDDEKLVIFHLQNAFS